MGVGVGDYDCDGHLNVLRTHYMNQATGLYHNLGKGEFEDVTAQAGLSASGALYAGARACSTSTTTATPTSLNEWGFSNRMVDLSSRLL